MQEKDVKKYDIFSGASKRVLIFLENQGITKYRFSKETGLSNKFLDNSENMTTNNACKVLHYYPQLNPEWLLTGKGLMLREVAAEAPPPEAGAPPPPQAPPPEAGSPSGEPLAAREPEPPEWGSRPIEEQLLIRLSKLPKEEQASAKEYLRALIKEEQKSNRREKELQEARKKLAERAESEAEAYKRLAAAERESKEAYKQVIAADDKVAEAKARVAESYEKLAASEHEIGKLKAQLQKYEAEISKLKK